MGRHGDGSIVLNVAVDQRVIARNPATRGVELPKVPRYRAQPLSPDEARALIAATRDDWLGAFWRLAVVTGLRLGELQGLAWSDVELGGNDARDGQRLDLPRSSGHGEGTGPADARLGHRAPRDVGGVPRGPSLTVRHALQRQDGQWVRAATKAARDLEVIAIDAVTAGVLEAHRKRQAAARQPDWPYWGLVFVTPTGRPYHRKEMGDLFRDACDRAGIARRRIHDLRHANSTMMRDLGIDREVRKARHGHSTDEMDARYSRPSAAQDRAAVELLAEVIG